MTINPSQQAFVDKVDALINAAQLYKQAWLNGALSEGELGFIEANMARNLAAVLNREPGSDVDCMFQDIANTLEGEAEACDGSGCLDSDVDALFSRRVA